MTDLARQQEIQCQYEIWFLLDSLIYLICLRLSSLIDLGTFIHQKQQSKLQSAAYLIASFSLQFRQDETVLICLPKTQEAPKMNKSTNHQNWRPHQLHVIFPAFCANGMAWGGLDGDVWLKELGREVKSSGKGSFTKLTTKRQFSEWGGYTWSKWWAWWYWGFEEL